MRWAALVAGFVVVATVCQLFRIVQPMDSFWRPHNLRRFRPYYVAPRTVCYFRAMVFVSDARLRCGKNNRSSEGSGRLL